LEEKQLIEACIQGIAKHQKILYDTYSGQMYSICLRYSNDNHQAQDILQNGFIKVFKNLGKFRNEGPLGAWIRRIILREAIQHVIAKKKERISFSTLEHEMNFDSDLEIADELTYDRIIQLTNNLPHGYRMVFTMFVLDEMSHSEIAELLNITESTSRTQLKRAKTIIRNLLLEKSSKYEQLRSLD
jgi:RNA polymerase sigma factor (sigma-70 family)